MQDYSIICACSLNVGFPSQQELGQIKLGIMHANSAYKTSEL